MLVIKNEEFMTIKNSKYLAQKIKIFMIKHGISQKDLAKKMKITPAAISKFLIGESDMRLETLNKISKALGVDSNYFFDNSTEVKGNQNIVQSKNISVGKMDYEKEILLIKKELEVQRYKLENLELKLEKNNKK